MNWPRYEILDIDLLEEDLNQPRNAYRDIEDWEAVWKDEGILINSIRDIWIQFPIIISFERKKEGEEKYMIIDGHRRYNAAKSLGLKKVPCVIHEELSEADFVLMQYQVQNVRKDWKPYERANALKRIRGKNNFKNNKEMSEALWLSSSLIRADLDMIDQWTVLLWKMTEFNLKRTYQVEFIQIRPKLRKIKEFQVHTIEDIIFSKVQNNIITSAKDFRKLKKIFLRAKLNEDSIYRFLTEEDMTVDELTQLTTQSRIWLLVDDVLEIVGSRIYNQQELHMQKEMPAIIKLRDFLSEEFPEEEYQTEDYKL